MRKSKVRVLKIDLKGALKI